MSRVTMQTTSGALAIVSVGDYVTCTAPDGSAWTGLVNKGGRADLSRRGRKIKRADLTSNYWRLRSSLPFHSWVKP